MHPYINITKVLMTISTGLALSACTTANHAVMSGDRVDISFICRFPDNSVAVTTTSNSKLDGEVKSAAYLPRQGVELETVIPGEKDSSKTYRMGKPFEQEVLDRLKPLTVGMKAGDELNTVLTANSSSGDSKPLKMSRLRKRDKELKLTLDEYLSRAKKKPELGHIIIVDPLLPGKVAEISDTTVTIRFAPVNAEMVKTPFGPATIVDKGDSYEIYITPQKGGLVRTGALVGVITEVDKDSMTIDFSSPFGGKALNCHMKVEDVKPAPESVSVPVSTPAAAATPVPAITAAVGGDVATINYSASLDDGSLIYSTRKLVAENSEIKKSALFKASDRFEAETVSVGAPAVFPGVGEAVTGMKAGEKKVVVIPPEKGFGQIESARLVKLPLEHRLQRTVTLPAGEYVKQVGSFPILGKELNLVPYFPAKVVAIRDNEVDLIFQVSDGASFKEPFGVMTVKFEGQEIITRLTPVIGSAISLHNGAGIISAVDESSFTVDQNHPLAGKNMVVEIEVESVKPANMIPSGEYDWKSDHDAALAAAKAANRPVVLVLHADWCSFCKKFFAETITDPRVRELRDRFDWIRVDSDKNQELKKRYAQEGFPKIIIFKGDGSESARIDGFVDAAAFRAALRELL